MLTAFASKAPTYAKVMELDRRVRDFPVPEVLRVTYDNMDAPVVDVSQTPMLQRLLGTLLKETSVCISTLLLHAMLKDHCVQLC